MNSLNLGISLETSLTQLATNPTLLNTTERNAEVAIIARVNPDHTRLDLGSNAVRTLDIRREHSRAKTVRGIVGARERLTLIGEGGDGNERPKHLLAVDAHVVLDVGEDGGGDEEALAAGDVLLRLTASNQLGALGLAALDVGQDAVVLRLRDLGALEGFVVEGVADLAGVGDFLLEEVDEFVVDGVVDEDARGGGADLALVVHDADVGPFGGLDEVGVVEDEEG